MRLPLFVFVAASGLAMAVASPSRAQRPTVGASVGLSSPASTLNESHKPGFNAAAHVGNRMPGSAVGFRLEAFYNLFDNTEFVCGGPCVLPGLSSEPVRIIGGAASVLVHLVKGDRAPYVIVGAGSYNVGTGGESHTNIGLNAGAGGRFRVAGVGAFVEARFHSIAYKSGSYDPKIEYIPVTFGIEF